MRTATSPSRKTCGRAGSRGSGIVELEEGPRMTTNIVGCAIEDVRIGMAVEAVYEDVNEEVTLVLFRPV